MNEPTDSDPPRDYGFIAIVVLVIVIAAWLLLTPWIPSVASATMRRFHLTTRSFPLWAVQFPIPPMYNFANRYEFSDLPPGLVDPILETGERRYINHFPARVATFSQGRYRNLRHGTDRWLTIESSYRGQTLTTRFHFATKQGSGYRMILLSSEESP